MTIADVAAFIRTLPGVTIGTKWGNRTWMLGDRGFAWQRPLNKADVKRLGSEPAPVGDVLAVVVENLDAKDALLAFELPGFFTIEHFNSYPAVLIELRLARIRDVRAAIVGAWRTLASPDLVAKLARKPARKPARKR